MEQQQQQQQQSSSSVRVNFDGLETTLPPPRPSSPPPSLPLKRPGGSGSVTPRSGLPRRPPSRRSSGLQQVSFSELREIFVEEASVSGGSPVATLTGAGPVSIATTSMAGSAVSNFYLRPECQVVRGDLIDTAGDARLT